MPNQIYLAKHRALILFCISIEPICGKWIFTYSERHNGTQVPVLYFVRAMPKTVTLPLSFPFSERLKKVWIAEHF